MSTKHTDQEWTSVIDNALAAVEKAHASGHPLERRVDDSTIAGMIDHTLLKLDATEAQIDELCREAKEEVFASVCVRQNFVKRARALLSGSSVVVAAVVGFHTGTPPAEVKLSEAQACTASGAAELDVVLNRDDLQAGRYGAVHDELAAIRDGIKSRGTSPVLLKLIFETSQLDRREVVAAAVLAQAAGFDFIKTSTGFVGHGATVEHVRLMRMSCDVLGPDATEETLQGFRRAFGGKGMRVKASGGVRSLADARAMIAAGADRLGTSAGMTIVKEIRGEKGGGSAAGY